MKTLLQQAREELEKWRRYPGQQQQEEFLKGIVKALELVITHLEAQERQGGGNPPPKVGVWS